MCAEQADAGDWGGWVDSAPAFISNIEQDQARLLLLDAVMLEQCGDVHRKRVLDLGCGEGRFCRMLAERGALPVGIDPIPAMIAASSARGGTGRYVRAMAESVPFAGATFDLVVSYITLVDIAGYGEAISEIARVLRPGGELVVANLNFTSASVALGHGWTRDESGTRLYVPIDQYGVEHPVTLEWSNIKIVNYHRPLARYMQAYLGAGLALRWFDEPRPSSDVVRDHPEWSSSVRVPWFTLMRWEKPA